MELTEKRHVCPPNPALADSQPLRYGWEKVTVSHGPSFHTWTLNHYSDTFEIIKMTKVTAGKQTSLTNQSNVLQLK